MRPYYQDTYVIIYYGDCRDILPHLDPVDLVLTDLPYGMTANSWDKEIPLNTLWPEYKRLNKGLFIFTTVQPFTSKLILSQPDLFKYEWVWVKNRPTGFPSSKFKPLVNHESILIFGNEIKTYNPQKTTGHVPTNSAHGRSRHTTYHGTFNVRNYRGGDTTRFPLSVQFFDSERGLHPNQKPVSLCRYFIKTYSNGGEIILDNAMGSGTTLRAAKDLGRKAIGIEIEEKYCEIAAKRMAQEVLDFRKRGQDAN